METAVAQLSGESIKGMGAAAVVSGDEHSEHLSGLKLPAEIHIGRMLAFPDGLQPVEKFSESLLAQAVRGIIKGVVHGQPYNSHTWGNGLNRA